MTSLSTPTARDSATDADNKSVIRRVASASAIGTAAEYYDFFAYGTAAVLFFGQIGRAHV